MSVLKLENISFTYDKKPIFKNLNLQFEKGKVYAIVGKSGTGKTTLLSVLSGLAAPTSGNVYYKGQDVEKMNKYDFRSKYVGVVFQSFNLLTKFTAFENVSLSMDIANFNVNDKKQYVYDLLESVGLDREQANSRILKLSGGQQQRVAIARALSYQSEVILADEPTGNLDGETEAEIIKILRDLANQGKCVIIVTHTPAVAKAADHIYDLSKLKNAK
ncbi:ABC transporter ATP-binding protein [Turicibacter bilis]|uniref:ABC transporter ATP-binding protein n=1 Tax=Turicibacter bilis TaxID=2735723 RepID=A0A9Q9FJ22_9FIRM|nr:ABC transporter ATP-binding protein [Turicibacter bilis]MBS3198631.1 ABC transporter ATP-binding protein [Turicibacter bilis]UUF08789.1 ABC transporter ATP-binding protein [Turicibacter bilis]